MANPYFQFKQFTIRHDRCSMKVTTDACLFGGWVARQMGNMAADSPTLDIGAGSGLLSLMLAQQHPVPIDAIEIQQSDYEQGLENIAAAGRQTQIRLFSADARSFSYPCTYDTILSNPPFYEHDFKSKGQSKNIAHHDEGLKLRELISIIRKQLNTAGNVYLLLPSKRAAEAEMSLLAEGLYCNELVWVNATAQHPPFRLMLRASFLKKEQRIGKLHIKNNEAYTPEFIQLLKDYYLHL